MSLAEVTQVFALGPSIEMTVPYSCSGCFRIMTRCMRFPVSKFPGQLVHSLPTKLRLLLEGMAVAVSRGYIDEFVDSPTGSVVV